MNNKRVISLEKKQAILQAASKVFVKKGFHRTQVEDIAKEADVAKGTVYLYFKSKEELFAALLENVFTQGFSTLENIKGMSGGAVEKLSIFIGSQLEFCEENIGLFIMMNEEIHHMDKTFTSKHHGKIMKNHERIISLLSAIMEQGIREKLLKQINPQLASFVLMGIVQSVLMKNMIFPGKETLTEQLPFIMDIFLKGAGRA